MRINRREFLKIAGLSTIVGLGGMSTAIGLRNNVEASQIIKSPEALTAKRWAMVVNLSKFKEEESIQKIAEACHRAHNVPTVAYKKHEIKWLWPEKFEHAFPEQEDEFLAEKIKHASVPLLCNHCDNPPCVRVCPTQATFKRADGIVMMDMHRCIGCRFCMAACPYGARSFNYKDPRLLDPGLETNPEFPTRMKGVVEKCTLCYERLAVGLEPACVKESNGGLIFGDIDDPHSEVREVLEKHYSIRRKPELGTKPHVYYILG
jgi:molybdopterin-containing oxidoreductase family iron-sulfur binding subunit